MEDGDLSKDAARQPAKQTSAPKQPTSQPAVPSSDQKLPQPNLNLMGDLIREEIGGNLTVQRPSKQPQHNPQLVADLIKSRAKGKRK
jgi:hypothetical protein